MGIFPNQSEITLHIDSVIPTSDPEIHRYVVSYLGESGPEHLCGVDSDGDPIEAYALSGAWDHTVTHIDDPSRFSFACRGFALAKCMELGYRPWSSVTECNAEGACHSLPLSHFHQA